MFRLTFNFEQTIFLNVKYTQLLYNHQKYPVDACEVTRTHSAFYDKHDLLKSRTNKN